MINPPSLDSHAHVWDRSCNFVRGARYHPEYEATIDQYLGVLDAHGIEQAVLVQPSFLGTDNRYLLACLNAYPDRLRGIVMLEPGTGQAEIEDLAGQRVIGVRYNLLSLAPTRLADTDYLALTQRLFEAGLWIEVQAHGPDWVQVLKILGNVRLMVDHFGKPSGPDCPGFTEILQRDPALTCVKLSAPYRQVPEDMTPYARRLLDHFGPSRCLWGSDWPWTQHETQHIYRDTVAWLDQWTAQDERNQIIGAMPGLLGFEAG